MVLAAQPLNLPVPIISALIGAVILLFGRKLFWLFVAAVGFAAGVEVAPHLLSEPSPMLALTLALVLGFIGALFALFLQKIAVGVVGFLVGGRLAIAVVAAFFLNYAHYDVITFLIGGIVGAILLLALFDWALIFFSSVAGAHLIQSTVQLPATGSVILLVALTVLGVAVQASMMRRGRGALAG
jgi:hypothetical protein